MSRQFGEPYRFDRRRGLRESDWEIFCKDWRDVIWTMRHRRTWCRAPLYDNVAEPEEERRQRGFLTGYEDWRTKRFDEWGIAGTYRNGILYKCGAIPPQVLKKRYVDFGRRQERILIEIGILAALILIGSGYALLDMGVI